MSSGFAQLRSVRARRKERREAREVRGEETRGERVRLLRESGNVTLHGSVEVDLSFVGEPHERGGGQRLGDAIDPEPRRRLHGDLPLHVRETESGGPDDAIFQSNRHRRSRVQLEDVGEELARAFDVAPARDAGGPALENRLDFGDGRRRDREGNRERYRPSRRAR